MSSHDHTLKNVKKELPQFNVIYKFLDQSKIRSLHLLPTFHRLFCSRRVEATNTIRSRPHRILFQH